MRPIEHARQEQKMITGPLAQRIQADDLNLSGNCRLSGNLLGGARRDRTADLLHAMQALSQLSYGPVRELGSVIGDQVAEIGFFRHTRSEP